MTKNQASYLSFPAAMSSTCDVMICGSTCAVVMRSRLQKSRFLESDHPSFRSRLNIKLLIFNSGCLPTNVLVLRVTLKEPETDYMRDNSIAKFKVFMTEAEFQHHWKWTATDQFESTYMKYLILHPKTLTDIKNSWQALTAHQFSILIRFY